MKVKLPGVNQHVSQKMMWTVSQQTMNCFVHLIRSGHTLTWVLAAIAFPKFNHAPRLHTLIIKADRALSLLSPAPFPPASSHL